MPVLDGLELRLSHKQAPGGGVTLTLAASGSGTRRFTLRAHNLRVSQVTQEARLSRENATLLRWECRIIDANAPWVAVVVPEGSPASRVEALGSPHD